MRSTLWQPALAPHKYSNIQIRVQGHCVFRRQETQVRFILIHRSVMPAEGGKRCFFSIAIVVNRLYSRPVVTETRAGEARSGKKYRRPYPFLSFIEGLKTQPTHNICAKLVRGNRAVLWM